MQYKNKQFYGVLFVSSEQYKDLRQARQSRDATIFPNSVSGLMYILPSYKPMK